MLLALGFAASCKEDMPQPTPEPTPVVPEAPGTPEPSTDPTNPTPPASPAEPTPSVPKSSDYRIATRMVVEPIKEKTAEMLSKLKIEDFAWRGNKDAIKLADLLPFVTFKASYLDGEPYTLTSEDLKQLELVDMKYEEHGSLIMITLPSRSDTITSRRRLSCASLSLAVTTSCRSSS